MCYASRSQTIDINDLLLILRLTSYLDIYSIIERSVDCEMPISDNTAIRDSVKGRVSI